LHFLSNENAIMKLSNLLLIFSIAIMCLFSLQASWLYYTYKLHLRNIEESINSIFSKTIEKELDHRFVELEAKAMENLSDMDIRIATFNIDFGEIENNSVSSQQIDIIKQLMATFDIHLSINRVDSIFNSNLRSNQYPFSYQINYEDSTGRIMETAGQSITEGFKTDIIHVINDEKIYAIVKIAAPVVFSNMFAILIASVLIFLLIISCLIYEIKLFIDQHHIIKLRENFSQALTHDMKTPLATIHSILVQIDKGNIDSDPALRQRFNSIAIDQVINLQTTVNQILTLAYIEKKQLSLNKQSIDLSAMIRSLIDRYTVKSVKSITFNTTFDLENGMIYADFFYLNNAISNLIDNAIKYSGKSVEIEIECTAGEKQIYIRVRDNGFGISSNDQLIIFKQFERGAEIRRNMISGFGIGLNYVQQVIEAHGGTVAVLSQEGKGSEFVITLPTLTNSTSV